MSLSPLLLVLVTVLGIVLGDNADLRNRILDTVYVPIPVVGAQRRESTTSLSSSGVILLIGLLVSLWSGLAVVQHAKTRSTFSGWCPRFQRPGFLSRSVRALVGFAVLGIGILFATAATNLAAFLPHVAGPGRLLAPRLREKPRTATCDQGALRCDSCVAEAGD